jgi:hypothetical protein
MYSLRVVHDGGLNKQSTHITLPFKQRHEGKFAARDTRFQRYSNTATNQGLKYGYVASKNLNNHSSKAS